MYKVIADRKGNIKDFEQDDDIITIQAEGKGEYSMEFSHYDEAPSERQDELIFSHEKLTSNTKTKK
ncbi:hypothetical protein MXB_5194 [Myxobolus squamalis]|nr:hypothetical protein MXB_5194 [Myxobolus squamalis]